jgi:hypothetical protein
MLPTVGIDMGIDDDAIAPDDVARLHRQNPGGFGGQARELPEPLFGGRQLLRRPADPVRHRDIALTVVEDRKFQPMFPLKLAVAVGNGLMRDGNERCTARTDVRRRIAKVL